MRSLMTKLMLPAFVAVFFFLPANAFAQSSQSTLHHVCVGVSQYGKLGPTGNLPFPHKDALDQAEFWAKQGQQRFASVRGETLINDKATTANVVSAINRVVDDAKAGDWVVITLAGHGGFLRPRDGDWSFMTHDSNPLDADSALSGAFLQGKLTALSKRGVTVILILDCCHSGAMTMTQAPYVVLAACQVNQLSIDDFNFRNGLFTGVLLEGLNGKADLNSDGQVTLEELRVFLGTRMPQLIQNQTPVVGHPTTLAGTFALVNSGNTTATAELDRLKR